MRQIAIAIAIAYLFDIFTFSIETDDFSVEKWLEAKKMQLAFSRTNKLKFIYSEKATKILRNLHQLFVLCTASQIIGGDLAFSEYMNFTSVPNF